MRFLTALLLTSASLVVLSTSQVQAFTISGSANLGFGMTQGPSTGFALGDVAVFEVTFDDDALATYVPATQSYTFDASILEFRVSVYRSGSVIYDILFVTPDDSTVDTYAKSDSTDSFYVTSPGPFPMINSHEIMFAGFAFSGSDIFAISPVAGTSYTISELFGDGSGLAAAPLDYVMSAPNLSNPAVTDDWHFLASSSVVPEPSSAMFFLVASLLGLIRVRTR